MIGETLYKRNTDIPDVYPTKPSSKAHRTLVPNFGIGAVARVDETCGWGESERDKSVQNVVHIFYACLAGKYTQSATTSSNCFAEHP